MFTLPTWPEYGKAAAKCIVCGKTVAAPDQAEHLRTNHLGPHYFWFDMKRYRTEQPSMTMAEVKRLVYGDDGNAPLLYQVYEERGGENIPRGDGEAVDLTHEPHFFNIPPATF